MWFAPFPRARITIAITLALLACVCSSARVSGQRAMSSNRQDSRRGRLSGIVRDAKGVAVAGANVVATNQVTSRRSRTRTNEKGRYGFRLLPGAYRINVEFLVSQDTNGERPQTFERENVIIAASAGDQELDIALVAPKSATVPLASKEPASVQPSSEQETPDVRLPESAAPMGGAGDPSLESATQTEPDRREVRDRFRVGFPEYDRYGDRGARGRDIPFRKGRWYNPYDASVIKGDFPFIGKSIFMIAGASNTSTVEVRRTPTPIGVSTDAPGGAEFFGQPESLTVVNTVQFSFELFRGNTVFEPRRWAFKFAPTFSLPNYFDARENGVVNIDPRRGTNRVDAHASLEEAFGEVKLMDVNENYDFVSVRGGIQPFVSDFRGFVFSDNNLGMRLFGGFKNNRYQFNLAGFTMLEKDTNSGLNRLKGRSQTVYVANLFRQDTFRKGYTVQVSALFNDDRGKTEFDENGFLVRPTPIGDFRTNRVKVGYIGFNGDGKLGLLNLTNSYYFAFGNESHNPIAGRGVKVRSHLAAAEASMDKDYLRFRLSGFFASGDKNPTDDRATGFDAIIDDPNFVGGQFSFWNRQGIRLTQTGVGLVQSNSLLPSLRSSKLQGQSNFVNPGIFIANAGLDIEITQKFKAVINVNYMRFHRTDALKYVLFQPNIRKDIGFDYSIGAAYRPFLINNITFNFGGAMLTNGRGLRDIFTDRAQNCPPNTGEFCQPDINNPRKPLYAFFFQAKFVF